MQTAILKDGPKLVLFIVIEPDDVRKLFAEEIYIRIEPENYRQSIPLPDGVECPRWGIGISRKTDGQSIAQAATFKNAAFDAIFNFGVADDGIEHLATGRGLFTSCEAGEARLYFAQTEALAAAALRSMAKHIRATNARLENAK